MSFGCAFICTQSHLLCFIPSLSYAIFPMGVRGTCSAPQPTIYNLLIYHSIVFHLCIYWHSILPFVLQPPIAMHFFPKGCQRHVQHPYLEINNFFIFYSIMLFVLLCAINPYLINPFLCFKPYLVLQFFHKGVKDMLSTSPKDLELINLKLMFDNWQ